MTKFITEILEEMNKNTKLVPRYKDNYAIKAVINYAFDPRLKFLLPPGKPPFKEDARPIGLSPANMYQQVKKFYIFCREDLSKVKRESIFIQLCESVHPSEADLLVLIKDQTLTNKYPNLTRQVFEEAGYLKPLPFRAEQPEVKPALTEEINEDGGRNLVLSLEDGGVSAQDQFGAPAPTKTVEEVAPIKRGRGRPKKNAN